MKISFCPEDPAGLPQRVCWYTHSTCGVTHTSTLHTQCAYTTPDIVNSEHAFLYIDQMASAETRSKQAKAGQVYRWRLPLPNATSNPTVPLFVEPKLIPFCDAEGNSFNYELARINDLASGTKHRYSYGYGASTPSNVPRDYLDWGLLKHDSKAAEAGLVGRESWRCWYW